MTIEPKTTDNPPADRNGQLHSLQKVIWAFADMPTALYLNGDFSRAGDSGPLVLNPGQRVDTNTYFNAFYAGYWAAHTGIDRAGFRVRFRGKLQIRIIGETAKGKVTTLAAHVTPATANETEVVVWPDLSRSAAPGANGRQYIELIALESSRIIAADMVTAVAPRQTVTLSIGLCCFNREDGITETVAALADFAQNEPALQQVYVVNQGRKFTNKTLISTLQSPLFSLIEQGNFGGCGGFNRTMLETVTADQPPTHHLLMDDDIRLDPRMISRAIRFLQYAQHDIAVGGHMLELENPAVLHEAGARVHEFWLVESVGHGADLTQPASLQAFAKVEKVDYNAWWFCMVPTRAIRAVGFSPPIFIHVDDIEYGCRLGENQVQTVALPGVAVWHESFAYKHVDWTIYYDLRNRLIANAGHPGKVRSADALFVLGFIMHFVLVHRYRAAKLSVLAVRDYLAGPQRFPWTGPDQWHASLIAKAQALEGPETVLRSEQANALPGPLVYPPSSIWQTVTSYVSLFFKISFSAKKHRKTLWFQTAAHPGATGTARILLATSPDGDTYLAYAPHKGKFWALTAQALFMALRFGLSNRTVAAAWKDALPARQTSEAWNKVFHRAAD